MVPLVEGASRWHFLAGAVLCTLWLGVALSHLGILPEYTTLSEYATRPPPLGPLWVDRPVEPLPATIDYPPVDSEAIRDVCARSQWNESLIFTCSNAEGSVAQVRTSVLTCVRYAIEAGATRLVWPRIHKQFWDRPDLAYMFDMGHFSKSLRLSCPQMKVIDVGDGSPDRPDLWGWHLPVFTPLPDSIFLVPMPEWREAFFDVLNQNVDNVHDKSPIIVDLDRVSPRYDVYRDGKAFAYAFGNILKLRSDARRMASTILQKLSDRYNISMDLSASTNLSSPATKDKFLGVHLYTEPDSLGPGAGWLPHNQEFSTYEKERDFYLAQASKSKLDIIYTTSTNPTSASQLAQDAKPKTVVTKYDLLGEGGEMDTLDEFDPEQQALVDYLVLERASEFAGIAHSAFSWNLALKRHTFSRMDGFGAGVNAFDDELSHIYGEKGPGRALAKHMWP